uniref:Uncharacterized protein n=1 Tax=Sphaerodactylus townsendi TaxID=933632 RepID=A0ACB8FRR8_9SAUR
MAEYLSLSEEALIQRCQEKKIPYEGKSVTDLRVLLIQSCREKVSGTSEVGVPWEIQLRREQMALEREKMEMEAREAKERRDLERARMEHEWRKVRMEMEKAKLDAEVKIPQQQWRSETACTKKAQAASEVDLALQVQLRRGQATLEREKIEMEARKAKKMKELERAWMNHERGKVRMEMEKAELEAEVKIPQQQWRSETACTEKARAAAEVDLPLKLNTIFCKRLIE